MKIDDGVEELLGLDASHGALLAGVLRRSPADDAKLKPVDFITEIDGRKIGDVADLRLIVSQIPVGREVAVDYIRGGSVHSAKIKVAELPKEPVAASNLPPLMDPDAPNATPVPPPVDDVLNGLQVTDLNDQSRLKFGISSLITAGVVVTNVQEGSPADAKGVLRGDVIEIACAQKAEIQSLANASDFTGLLKNLKADQSVVLLIHRGHTSNFLYLAPQR
jgi:serine protease Do